MTCPTDVSTPVVGELKYVWAWPAKAPQAAEAMPPNSIPAEFLEQQNRSRSIDRVIPARGGRPGAILLTTGVAHDEATGRPLWMGQSALEHRPLADRSRMLIGTPPQFVPKLLNAPLAPGAHDCDRPGCHSLPRGDADLGRRYDRAAAGKAGRARPIDRQPRWTRPLPWHVWLDEASSDRPRFWSRLGSPCST